MIDDWDHLVLTTYFRGWLQVKVAELQGAFYKKMNTINEFTMRHLQ